MNTLSIQNVPTTNTGLSSGYVVLYRLYVTNTTASNANFSMLVGSTHFIKDVVIPPGVTLSVLPEDGDNIHHTLSDIYVKAGTANALDVVYTAE